ncbi:MAG: oligosaccharide flippase family protein [Deltaproteobacteria bacterium]|nr:oligosaccharide flippase family protein [Deltaproteobacteria bacterium]
MGVGFFMLPFLVHRLGNNLYGMWVLVLSMTGYMVIFDLGIRGSVVKYVAEFDAKNDFKTLNSVVNTSWVIHIIAGLSIVAVSFILSFFLNHIFKIDNTLINDFTTCFRIMGLCIGFTLCFSVLGGILEGYKRTDIVSAIEGFCFIIQSALIVLSVLRGHGIIVLAVIIFGVNILKQITRLVFVRKICTQLKLDIFLFSKEQLKLIFSYSTLLFVYQSLRNIISSLPNMILGIFLGPAAVTFYSIAGRLMNYCITFLFTATTVLVPFISSFDALNDKARLSKSFIVGSKYSYMLTLFFGSVLLIMGRPFLGLWMGSEFAQKSYPVLFIMVFSFMFVPSALIIEAVLKGLGRFKEICLLIIAEMAIGIILGVILLKKFGIAGLATGFALPILLNYGIILPIFVGRILRITFNEYIKNIFATLIIPAMVLGSTLIILRSNLYPDNYLILFIEVLLSSLLYFVLCFRLVLSKYERAFYLSRLRMVLRGHKVVKASV